MAKGLAEFANGAVASNDNAWDPELSTDIIQYIETESDFRQFVKVVNTDSFAIVLPRRWSAGIAVEVVEGSEIPKAHDVYDNITLNLRQNGTGIRMTDEAKIMMKFDQNYWDNEARRATERMMKKENVDISNVLLAGAGLEVQSANATLTFDDIVDTKTQLEENPYGVNPNVILMSARSYADLIKDPNFKVYANSGIPGVVNTGDVGMSVDGMAIMKIPEVGDNVYLIDTTQDPLWLVQMGTMNTERYRVPETREDVLDLTLYEKPAVLRPDAIAKIAITRTDEKRTFPKGWDPLTGYPSP